MKTSALLFFAALFSASFATATAHAGFVLEEFRQPCKVTSKKWPELRDGINKATICSEVKRELNRTGLLWADDTVDVKVALRSQYDLVMIVKMTSKDAKPKKTIAQLSWYPGGDVYVQLLDVMPKRLAEPVQAPRNDTEVQDPR